MSRVASSRSRPRSQGNTAKRRRGSRRSVCSPGRSGPSCTRGPTRSESRSSTNGRPRSSRPTATSPSSWTSRRTRRSNSPCPRSSRANSLPVRRPCTSKRSAGASSRQIELGRPQISARDFRSPMAAPRFADAVAKYDEAWIALFGVPYDRTCSFRGGSRFGPRAIREASYNFETYMMDHQRDLRDVAVADLGDTPTFGASTKMVDGVTHMAADVVRGGKIPIVIGGEHSLAPAVVRAFPKDVGVIGIDAHLDFRDSYLSDRWSHACSARRIADHVGVEHVVYIGVRSYSREEREDLERLGLTYVSVFDVHERGIGAAVDRALKAIHRDKVYLTIDIDGVDPAFAPAVGNPEPFGLAPLQVKKVIGMLAPGLVGMDLNEVSPAWDFGQTALLGARLIREAIVAIGEARGHVG